MFEMTPERSAAMFWARVQKGDGCWLWTGAYVQHRNGRYGRLMRNGRYIKAHRFAYELCVGPVPDGIQVLHRCDNPPCVRPDHLFLGTHDDNMQDMVSKGRRGDTGLIGERHGMARLTEADVRAIRDAYAKGATLKALATRFGINFTHIHRIVRRVNWQHVS